MLELDSHKILKEFDDAATSSIVSGNQSIEDNSPNYSDTGAWIPLPQKSPTMTRYRNNI